MGDNHPNGMTYPAMLLAALLVLTVGRVAGCNIPFEDVGPGCQSGYITGQVDGFSDAYACLEPNWFTNRKGGVYGDCYKEGYYEAYEWATTAANFDRVYCPDGVDPNPDNDGAVNTLEELLK